MGKLVTFVPQRRPAKPQAPKPGSAQILMFTGVRYERGTTPLAAHIDPTPPLQQRG